MTAPRSKQRMQGRPCIDREIGRLQAAIIRGEERRQELWRSVDYPGQDEHVAALGGDDCEYSRLGKKQKRQWTWLAVLLRKRGGPTDITRANSIELAEGIRQKRSQGSSHVC